MGLGAELVGVVGLGEGEVGAVREGVVWGSTWGVVWGVTF